MRKSTLLRALCLTVLAVLASFGVFNVTAQPAHALWCAETLGFCGFTHVWYGPDGACCMYSCPNGGVKMGMCEKYWPEWEV
ncbi:MAG TPA: hypothetical protein VF789_20855 [Thermoanaerobaculia bacterium]